MKHLIRIAVVTIGMLLFFAAMLHSKTEYTKKEGKSCATCHVKAGSKDLNDVGKCYEKGKSLKDCITPK